LLYGSIISYFKNDNIIQYESKFKIFNNGYIEKIFNSNNGLVGLILESLILSVICILVLYSSSKLRNGKIDKQTYEESIFMFLKIFLFNIILQYSGLYDNILKLYNNKINSKNLKNINKIIDNNYIEIQNLN
jgi:hypothetical protein